MSQSSPTDVHTRRRSHPPPTPGTTSNQPQPQAHAASASAAQAQLSLSRVSEIAQQGVTSKAWLYPVKGILYLIGHPSLLRPLIPTIALSLFVSLILTVSIFGAFYLPLAGLLAVFNGPIGFLSAATVLLSLSGTAVNALARSLFLQQALERVFDQVLLDHSLLILLSHGRELKKSHTGRRLGAVLTKPLARFSPRAILTYILSLPLNLIPLVGTVFFVLYNGVRTGPGWHERYFVLKRLDKREKEEWANIVPEDSFGAAAIVLNMIPLMSLFFTFTTDVGAALWACDEEKLAGKAEGVLAEGRTATAVPQTSAGHVDN
ncbi:hypothetical protein DACRYDRAFT_108257 [Dacryopinax primogenitus]|uniref:Uncharacterized protein n=1 Tax=Dacryopinax primogenitus (strain DJM 731) TaxID=1858805 RepID=M5G4X0_DACPD|nr:uncharacterized protein DACRYDRAFT_108257 [Dacryopinax primogenitus]EJU00902.1 hypothetical protein DACRYDRAFT_108257 [Dacryopinax primogenitus]